MFAQSVGQKKRRTGKKKQKGKKETNGVSNSHVAISHSFWPVWWLLPATSNAGTGQCVQPVHDWSVLALLATNLLISALSAHLPLPAQQGDSFPSAKNTGEMRNNPYNGKKTAQTADAEMKRSYAEWSIKLARMAFVFNYDGGKAAEPRRKMTFILTEIWIKTRRSQKYPYIVRSKKRMKNKKEKKWFNGPLIVDRERKLWRNGRCNVCRGFCCGS